MTPEFSAKVDPIFLQVFDLLERIGRRESTSLEYERSQICKCIDIAEGKLGNTPEWQLAKYALVCWIDEVLTDVDWEHRSHWSEVILEFDYFKSNERYSKFYANAEQASQLPPRDALEIYYIACVLGFQGLYRPPQNGEEQSMSLAYIQQYRLPPDRELWVKRLAIAIHSGRDQAIIPENAEPIEGALPLTGPEAVIWPTLFGLTLVAVTLILGCCFPSLIQGKW